MVRQKSGLNKHMSQEVIFEKKNQQRIQFF